MELSKYFDQSHLYLSALGAENREISRPLGALSTYVVDNFPHDLANVRRGNLSFEQLFTKIELLVSSLNFDDIINLSDAEIKVARVDAQFIYNGLIHLAGCQIPASFLYSKFYQLSRMLAEHLERPMVLTYEDCVLDNPKNDMRVFSAGQIGQAEAGFFRAHQLIEEHLEKAIMFQKMAIEMIQNGDTGSDSLLKVLKELLTNWSFNNKYTAQLFTLMNHQDFLQFRGNLGGFTDPSTGEPLKGASGQQSARVRIIDLLFAGDIFYQTEKSEVLADITRTFDYYPRENFDALLHAMDQAKIGNTLLRLALDRKCSPKVLKTITKFHQQKSAWRVLHLRAVKVQMPDVMVGTGGENIESYLRNISKETQV